MPVDREVQTRSADGELRYFNSVREAFNYSKVYAKVWKVSWSRELPDGRTENIRFVRRGHPDSMWWEFESIDQIVEEAASKK